MKKRTIIILLTIAQIGAFYLKGHSQQLAKPDTWLNTYADTMSYKIISTATRLRHLNQYKTKGAIPQKIKYHYLKFKLT
jgi:hypothetical protein